MGTRKYTATVLQTGRKYLADIAVKDNPLTDAELQALVDDVGKEELLPYAARSFSPEGFFAFFELMHQTPMVPHTEQWIYNAFGAHDENKGLLQRCHRESGKTTVFSKFFFAWLIGHAYSSDGDPTTNIIIRIADEKAQETAAIVAHMIMHDPKWGLVFPHVKPDEKRGWGASKGYYLLRDDMSKDEWAEQITKAPDGPSFIGRGWKSGAIIGSRFNGVMIVDDIHDGINTASNRMIQSVKDFANETLEYCLLPGVWELWNYTPWKTNDAYAMVEATGLYVRNDTPVLTPADENEEGAEYWEHDENVPISGAWYHRNWKEQWSFERIGKKYRKTGAMAFARQMLLDLEATKGLTLKNEWIHEYPAADIRVSWPVYFGVDYASTADKTKRSGRDYFCLAVLRGIPGGGLVLVDGYRGRISKGEALQMTAAYGAMYPTLKMVGVETHGKGEEYYNDLLLSIDVAGKPMPLIPITHGRVSKGWRIQEWLAPRFQAARIWMSDTPTEFIAHFKNEWLEFPNSKHDDTLDACYMGAKAAEGMIPSQADRQTGAERRRNRGPNPYNIAAW